MTAPTVRVVNHDDSAGMQLQTGPQSDGLEELAVSNLPDALKPTTSKTFPRLSADEFRPRAEESLTVRAVSCAHPVAFTVVLGDSLAQADTPRADLAHTDETMGQSVGSRNHRIHNTLDAPGTNRRMKPEPVDPILVRELDTIHHWVDLVEESAERTCIAMSPDRCRWCLPKPLAGLILRWKSAPAATGSVPITARNLGPVCREHRYSAAMMEEESRKLQVSTLNPLGKNSWTVHLGSMVPSVVALADEVNSLRISRRRFTMRL